MTYYGQNGTYAIDVPPAWMAAHVDFVQGNAAQCMAFHAAGGFKCGAYVRAPLQFKCPSNGEYGACDDDLGRNVPEVDWYHIGGNGTARIYGCQDGVCYNTANPAAQAVRAAFRRKTAQLKMLGYDYAFCDDVTAVNFPARLGIWWNFSGTPYEITLGDPDNAINDALFNAKWRHAVGGLLNSGALPCWANSGAGPYFVGKSDRNVIGVGQEAGFVDPQHGRMGIEPKGGALTWDEAEDRLLAAILHGHGQLVLVMPEGSAVDSDTIVAERLYALASFWISYDPAVSVMESFFQSPLDRARHPVTVYPEYQIVPTRPLQTARDADIMHSALCATAQGPCFREFSACYQSVDSDAGVVSEPRLIGRCAAIVNVTISSVDVPDLKQRYSSSLRIDVRSTWSGGRATWTRGVPSTLQPLSAYILRG